VIWNFGQVGSTANSSNNSHSNNNSHSSNTKELNRGQCVVLLFPYAKDVAQRQQSFASSQTGGPSESEILTSLERERERERVWDQQDKGQWRCRVRDNAS